MADVKACPQGSFHVGAVAGIDIHRIVGAGLLCCIDELAHHLVAVGAAGILGADGNLLFGALKTISHAAHVHGDGFRHTGGDGGGAAVAHLFIDRHMGVNLPFGDDCVVFQVLGKAQEDTDAELVIQETAL